MMIHVAEFAPEFVFVHAGAVAWQNRALLLAGRQPRRQIDPGR
jgi:hypothetical protein